MTHSSDKYGDDRCTMRKVNGDPCEMPALKGESLCHYHKVMGTTPVTFDNQTIRSTHVYLPRLESAGSIQAAISEVCELMLHRRIEPKEASALFYAMQVASQNLGPVNSQALPPGTIQACADQRRKPKAKRRLKAIATRAMSAD